jgi:hypothetical protein
MPALVRLCEAALIPAKKRPAENQNAAWPHQDGLIWWGGLNRWYAALFGFHRSI